LCQGCLGARGNDQDVFITKGRHFGEQLAFRARKAASISRKQKGGCTVNVYRRGEKSVLLGQSSKIAVEAEVQRAWISFATEF
jgi:hypothetical protein